MAVNLIDLVQGYLTPDVISRLSSFLGENNDNTKTAISAAIPGLLSALDRSASASSAGAKRITDAVNNTDDTMLDNLGSTFSRGLSSETGGGVLSSILGNGGVSELAQRVGELSGLSGKGSLSLITMLAPMVFGVIRKVMRTLGPGFDISSLLASQRSNIAAAMPVGMEEEVYSGPRIAARGRGSETYEPSTHTGTNWILPIALLAGIVGLIWYFGSRAQQTAFVPKPTVQAAGEEGGRSLSLRELKVKYASALREAQIQGVRISDLREQNGKLVLMGTAPSQRAVNKVWDEIKRADPSMSDVMVSIKAPPGY
jgi:hypothetical protein